MPIRQPRERGLSPSARLTNGHVCFRHLSSARPSVTLPVLDGIDLHAYMARLGIATDWPLDGLAALVATRRTLDRLETLLVAHARAGGSSWAEVGEALELSRQAAHARHRPDVNETGGDSPRSRG